MSSLLFLVGREGFASFIPVILVIICFWLIAKKRRERENRRRKKDDAWYIIKDYLKRTGRQGYRVYDLALYPRTNNMLALRDYIETSQKSLEKENARLLNRKVKKPTIKEQFKRKIFKKAQPTFPKHEEYQRKLELQTLKVLANKYSHFQSFLQEYLNWVNKKEFQKLIKDKLIGESLAKLTKNKKLAARGRYLVCFKTIEHGGRISGWEAIEVELIRNPSRSKKEKYKILLTASIDFRKELHWIYSLQLRHYQDKRDSMKHAEKELKSQARRAKAGKVIAKVLFLDYLLPAASYIRRKIRK